MVNPDISTEATTSTHVTPKVYPHYVEAVASNENSAVMIVNLKWLENALRGDYSWASTVADRTDETFEPHRYENVVKQIQDGRPLLTPWLYFSRGRIQIMDGRHRLYALIDLDYTHVPVVVNPKDIPFIATIADPDPTGSNFGWNKRTGKAT